MYGDQKHTGPSYIIQINPCPTGLLNVTSDINVGKAPAYNYLSFIPNPTLQTNTNKLYTILL